MVFQEPINSLNPAYRIKDQIAEAIHIRHLRESGKEKGLVSPLAPYDYSKRDLPKAAEVLTKPLVPSLAKRKMRLPLEEDKEKLLREVLEYLRLVRINDPETILGLYPHELSGGMRQRVMIAIALSGRPSLLIADEPTSALDITIQAQVLTLMKELMTEVNTSILFISHDLKLVGSFCDRVLVMYGGRIVETLAAADLDKAAHPYTRGLLAALPGLTRRGEPIPVLERDPAWLLP